MTKLVYLSQIVPEMSDMESAMSEMSIKDDEKESFLFGVSWGVSYVVARLDRVTQQGDIEH